MMPPRAFPYPLRLGTDICHVPRIKSILTANIGGRGKDTSPLYRFLSKIFTWPERKYFLERFHSIEKAYEDIDNVSQYLAGR